MTTLHLVQTHLHWEKPGANREDLGTLISDIDEGLIVLPEMFSTGFSMASSKLAENMAGPTVTWMKDTAKRQGASLCGSVIIEEESQYFNRFICVTPENELVTYDKRHLFRMADEHQHYAAGEINVTLTVEGVRIRPQVCYDLRFPAWSRNQADDRYDVLLYVANWPAARSEQWLALLRARAIENLCYVIGLNRIGRDGNDIDYSGDSVVFGPEGETIMELGNKECIAAFTPDIEHLTSYRERFPAHMDADRFEIK